MGLLFVFWIFFFKPNYPLISSGFLVYCPPSKLSIWITILVIFFFFPYNSDVNMSNDLVVHLAEGTENLNAYLNFIWTILSFRGSVKLELKSHGNWLSQEIFGEPEILWEQPFPWCFGNFYFGRDKTRKFRGEWEWKITKW